MDGKKKQITKDKVVEQKLSRTTNRIKKARKNQKIVEKEAAEFEEIHKLLENTENDSSSIAKPKPIVKVTNTSDCNTIPLCSVGVKIFHDELIFSLFSEESLCLKSFIDYKEKCLIFGKDELVPQEECFRKLIAYHIVENFMPEEGKCSSMSLYVLYLMSVHQDPAFVSSCFDFLKFRPFRLQSRDIFPIFINFGAKSEDLFGIREEAVFRKIFENDRKFKKISNKPKFPYFNMEMVGRILLHYVTADFIVINSDVKLLVNALAKITLESRIRSGCLLPLYSILLSTICAKANEVIDLKEIVSWLYREEEDLLNRLELCRIVSKTIFPQLHNTLILKNIFAILKVKNLPKEASIKIGQIKLMLKQLKTKELPPLEFYSVLQLINGSLPGVTATVEDSLEINKTLTSLERKISETEDSIDLIRLKLEIAKVRNLIANNINDRFAVDETLKTSPTKKLECSK